MTYSPKYIIYLYNCITKFVLLALQNDIQSKIYYIYIYRYNIIYICITKFVLLSRIAGTD